MDAASRKFQELEKREAALGERAAAAEQAEAAAAERAGELEEREAAAGVREASVAGGWVGWVVGAAAAVLGVAAELAGSSSCHCVW